MSNVVFSTEPSAHTHSLIGEGHPPMATHVVQLGPYPPPHGGVQSNIVAIRTHLRSRGARATVINLTRFRRTDADDVFYPSSALELVRLLYRLHADVIHLHIGGNLTRRLLALGLLCCSLRSAMTVLTFHSGGFPGSPGGRRLSRYGFAAFVLRRFDGLIAVNQEIVNFFCRLGCAPERIHCIRPDAVPSVDAGSISHDPAPPQVRAFLARHDPALITVGLLEPEYDLPLQIALIGRLAQRHPGVGLAIIGAGSLEADLRAVLAACPWGDRIALCCDVPHAGTLRAIAESRMLLRTTHYDGDSVSVREALHLGTPVVASDNGMRPLGVRVVPPRDLDALETAVEALLVHPPGARLTAVAGDERNIALVAELYTGLAPNRRASAD